MKTLVLVFSLMLLFFGCQTENNDSIPVTPISKSLMQSVQNPDVTLPVLFEFLPSTFDVTSNNIVVQITDEFSYVRSRNFYALLTYQESTIVLYLGEYIPMNFIVEGYGGNNFQSITIYSAQGD